MIEGKRTHSERTVIDGKGDYNGIRTYDDYYHIYCDYYMLDKSVITVIDDVTMMSNEIMEGESFVYYLNGPLLTPTSFSKIIEIDSFLNNKPLIYSEHY